MANDINNLEQTVYSMTSLCLTDSSHLSAGRFIQCSTTGVTKAVVCGILSVG